FSPAPAAEEKRLALGPLATRPAGSGPVELRIEPPVVRIGLSTDSRRITLDSAGDYFIVDPETGRSLWSSRHQGPVHVVLQLKGGEPAARYRVQVAALASEEAANALREKIERETHEVAVVAHDPDRGVYRIRVGAAASRQEIQPVEDKLHAMGFAETWVVEETVGKAGHLRLRLVNEDYEDLVIEPRPFLVLPSEPEKPISVDGTSYRGAVEIRVLNDSRLKAVNILNLEDYLRGVVPFEMGPTIYPELEALKAQAVAARTYVVANRNQFEEEGYDICDSARCQVYGGRGGEDPLTDEAVETTRGQIATFDGGPINALYTATCGGHTEDVVNVFSEEADEAPYLKGVPCYADEAALLAWRRTLAGAPVPPAALDPSGARIDDALALLEVLGVIPHAARSPENLQAVATPSEIAGTVAKALAIAGKTSGVDPMPSNAYPSTAAFSAWLIRALGWSERVELLLDPRDLPSLLGGDSLPGGASGGLREAAYLIKDGILPPRLAPGDDLLAPATHALLYRVLFKILERYDALDLHEAIFRGSHGKALLVVPSEAELAGLAAAIEIEPDGKTVLARASGDRIDLVPEISLIPGDRLLYHETNGRVAYIRQKANERGASDDRFTVNYQWEVRYSREDLEERIRQRASIGTLLDVVPMERGVSGRVSTLRVLGSRGKFTFRGFGIRSLLGLRENLFVVDRQRGADGRVQTFVFSGKGWGHGVGLCQVGAFGMALRGATYAEILSHYYTGITIEPLRWE
ncbi:MAG TPA: SpoIID/LytB domain-containing protein, partial [Candidatus Saccharimonadales bacterium]|nr:SpoIID/LytB domain-containing protein [Candidatus Saccharimonadales bacterium]